MDASLTEIAVAAPPLVRLAVGLVSALLVVAGARWYHFGLLASAFAAGAAIVASVLGFAAQWVPVTGQPSVVLVASLTGGLALALGARSAHKVAMFAAGALTGLIVGAVIVQLLTAPVWVAPLAMVIGALSFPWFYKQLLKIVTPAVGAAGIAWAVGLPAHPLVLGGVWAFGAAVQFAGDRGTRKEDEE